MPRYKVTSPDGKSVMVEGDKPPTDADLDGIFAQMQQREAIVAPAVRGAMQRNAQANEMGPGGDPRLSAAQNVNMERATNTGIALAPVAGAAVGLPVVAGGMRALGAGRAAMPLAGAVMDAAPELLRGDIAGAATDAIRGAIAGKALQGVGRLFGAAAGAARPTLSRLMGSAAPEAVEAVAARSAPAVAQAAAPVAQTVGAMMASGNDAAQKVLNGIMRDFAKKAAPTAKLGEKIWVKLDSSGMPVDVVTSSQAARLPEALKTFVKRTWS